MKKEISSKVFHEVYPTGKIQMNIGDIAPDYVTATCSLYETRQDPDAEYLISEVGIVERSKDLSLSEMIAAAKAMAYENAMDKIIPRNGSAVPAQAPISKPTAPQEPAVQAAPPAEPETALEATHTGALDDILFTDDDVPGEPELDLPFLDADGPEAGEPTAPSTIQKVDLFAEPQVPAPKTHVPDADEQAIEKARKVVINILGKMNDLNGATAGRILDTAPEVIVEFAPLYTGPKVEQKEALMALYPEAVRRTQKAA